MWAKLVFWRGVGYLAAGLTILLVILAVAFAAAVTLGGYALPTSGRPSRRVRMIECIADRLQGLMRWCDACMWWPLDVPPDELD